MVSQHVGSLADRAVLSIMKRPSRYPTPADYVRLQAELDQTCAVYERAGLFASPTSLHAQPEPLVWPAIRRARAHGLRYEKLSWGSCYEPEVGDAVGDRWRRYRRNHTAFAWVLRHPEPAPWLICVHGLGTGSAFLDFHGFRAAHLHQTLGYNLAFPLLPLHGPRRERGMHRAALLSFELLETIHGIRQAVRDTRRLIGWVRTQEPPALGIYGMSMGALVASLVAGTEPLDLALLAIPMCDIPSLFESHGDTGVRERAAHFELLGDRMRKLYWAVSYVGESPRVPHEGRFLVAGRCDRFTTPVQAERLWDSWQRPTIGWYDGGHLSFFWSKRATRHVDSALRNLTPTGIPE